MLGVGSAVEEDERAQKSERMLKAEEIGLCSGVFGRAEEAR